MEMFFDGKSTLSHYGLQMKHCYITTPIRKRHLVDILAADGNVDIMDGIGEPVFENRTVTASFRMLLPAQDSRERIISDLEGRTVQIVLPDDLRYYMTGRVHIAGVGQHIGDELTITADCLPWRIALTETVHEIAASEEEKQYRWRNGGRRLAIPTITVGDTAAIITINGVTKVLPSGTHILSEFGIPGYGTAKVSAHGGAFTARYKEAIL